MLVGGFVKKKGRLFICGQFKTELSNTLYLTCLFIYMKWNSLNVSIDAEKHWFLCWDY